MNYSNYTLFFKFFSYIQILLVLVLPTISAQQTPKKLGSKNSSSDSSTGSSKPSSNIYENSSSKKKLTYEVVFEMNKSNLNISVKDKLNRVIKVYQNNFTDTLNIVSANTIDQLFKDRSFSVTNYLISHGVPSSHIRCINYGKMAVLDGIELIIK